MRWELCLGYMRVVQPCAIVVKEGDPLGVTEVSAMLGVKPNYTLFKTLSYSSIYDFMTLTSNPLKGTESSKNNQVLSEVSSTEIEL